MVSAYPPDKGRLSEYCLALTNALLRKGLRIRIGSDSPSGSIQNLQVEELWKPDNALSLLKIPRFIAASGSEFVLFNISFAVFGRSRVTNFIGLVMMSLTSRLGRLLRYRTIVIAHNLPDAVDARFFGLKLNLINRIGFLIGERLLFSCDATVVTLRLYRKMMERRFRRKVDYIPHGSWYSSERKEPTNSERNNLLFFGYLSPSKDMNLVAEVFNKLKTKHKGIRLRLVASPHPNFPHDLRQLRPFEGMSDVERIGYAEERELPRVFEGCFAIILPYTAATGTSGVLHLATAFGLPVVATNIPELRETMAEGPGLTLSNSPDDMAEILDRLFTDRGYWSEMSRRSLEFSKRLRWENIADRFLELMKRIEIR